MMASSRPEDSNTSQRDVKRGTKVVEFLNFKTDGSLKKGQIQNLSDNELIRKQHMTRTSVASSVTGAAEGAAISLACPVVYVGLAITSAQTAVALINRHRVRREVKQRARSDANFAKVLSEQDRTLKKARDIALGCSVRVVSGAVTMGIVGFDTVAENLLDLGGAAVASATNAATDVTGTAHVVSHVAAHAAGGAIDPSNASGPVAEHVLTIHEQFTAAHPHAEAGDELFHKATQGISDGVANFMTGKTGLDFNADSGLHQIQDAWDAADGDLRTEMVFVGQAVVDGGTAELAQPLQQVSDYYVMERARNRRWDQEAHQYEKLEDV